VAATRITALAVLAKGISEEWIPEPKYGRITVKKQIDRVIR
jgi:hypothetical protein